MLTLDIQASQILQGLSENRKHPCPDWPNNEPRSKQQLILELCGASRRCGALLEVDEEQEGKCTSC